MVAIPHTLQPIPTGVVITSLARAHTRTHGHYPIKNYRCCTGGGPTLNYGRQLSLYVPYMLRVNMTGDLAHLQLSDLQGETRPVCRTSDSQGEKCLYAERNGHFSY